MAPFSIPSRKIIPSPLREKVRMRELKRLFSYFDSPRQLLPALHSIAGSRRALPPPSVGSYLLNPFSRHPDPLGNLLLYCLPPASVQLSIRGWALTPFNLTTLDYYPVPRGISRRKDSASRLSNPRPTDSFVRLHNSDRPA
jgi:hypothetical protein